MTPGREADQHRAPKTLDKGEHFEGNTVNIVTFLSPLLITDVISINDKKFPLLITDVI